MKKFFLVMFSAFFMFTASNTTFAAQGYDYDTALQLIEETNQAIDVKIAEGVAEADKLQKEYLAAMEFVSESERGALTAKYEAQLTKIIDKVFYETLNMSSKTIEQASKLGVKAECSWRLVRFADREVWIDPIKVVGRN
jgi:hypothetical protein